MDPNIFAVEKAVADLPKKKAAPDPSVFQRWNSNCSKWRYVKTSHLTEDNVLHYETWDGVPGDTTVWRKVVLVHGLGKKVVAVSPQCGPDAWIGTGRFAYPRRTA